MGEAKPPIIASANNEGTMATISLGERHPMYPGKYLFLVCLYICVKKTKNKLNSYSNNV
jgi:hypothetical protein